MKPGRPTPLILATLCWVGGLLLGRVTGLPTLWLILAALCFLTACLILRYRSSALLALIVALGALRISLPPEPDHLTRVVGPGVSRSCTIDGEVVFGPDSLANGFRYRLVHLRLDGIPVSGAALLSTQEGSWRPGDEMRFRGTVDGLPETTNPDSPAWDEYYRGRGIAGFITAHGDIAGIGHHPRPWTSAVMSSRGFIARRLERLGSDAAFARSLTLGIPSPWDLRSERLQNSGLTHLIAVSGLHVAVLALVLRALLVPLFRRRTPARIMLVATVLFYASMCDWTPAVARAGLMIALYQLTRIFQRNVSINQLLALSLLIITGSNPHQIFNAGLQLSFLCVFALVNLVPDTPGIRLDHSWLNQRPWLRNRVRDLLTAVISSFIVGVVISPVTLLHFHQATFNAVIGNLLGIPLFGIILPLALLVAVLPAWSGLVGIYAAAFDGCLRLFDAWLGLVSRLPLRIDFVPFSAVHFWILTGLLLAAGYALTRRTWRWGAAPALCLAMPLLSLHPHNPGLRMTFFDVGMGDAALVQAESCRVLIDTGTGFAFHRVVLPYLKANGIDRLDAVILSHGHEDHAGGLAELVRECRVERLLVAPGFRVGPDCPATVDTITTELRLGSVAWSLFPPSGYDTGNDASLCARLDYLDFSALFTGDLDMEGEKELLDNTRPGSADVLKIPHHGSRYGTSGALLDEIRPRVAVISAPGTRQFPDRETLDRLTSMFGRVLVTGTDGAVIVETNGKTALLRGYRSGREIRLDVSEEP